MNARLLPAIGQHRLQAHAIRLLHAIAAAFAHFFVDHQAMHRLGVRSARTLAALFGGAFLVVNHRRHARNFFQLAQSVLQL